MFCFEASGSDSWLWSGTQCDAQFYSQDCAAGIKTCLHLHLAYFFSRYFIGYDEEKCIYTERCKNHVISSVLLVKVLGFEEQVRKIDACVCFIVFCFGLFVQLCHVIVVLFYSDLFKC